MEDSLSAMSFADDLIYYFAKYEGVEWETSIEVTEIQSEVQAYLYEVVAQAVHITFLENIQDIRECKQEMIDECIVTNHDDLSRLALEVVPSYFPYGYTHETFVGYCAMVMGVAILFFYETNDIHYLEYASAVVSIVLIGFIMNGDFTKNGGYSALTSFCEHFVDALEELKKLRKKKKSQKKKNKKKEVKS